ncbi:MAG: creatininase family protein [Ignavibacterium sp.]|jgi:creatinine amidohydrolase|nr:creatininase family protein [Ignavibacterium sp.]
MRPFILAENNWKDIKQSSIDLAVLPWGATEAHNYHLPYSADVIESTSISEAASEKAFKQGAKIIVLPAIPYGVNTGQTDIKLDMNINPSTQAAILNDLIEVLNRQQIFKLLIVNGHGGNDFKPILRELGLKFPKMFLSYCNWFNSLPKEEYFEHDGDHADEMETSMLLYLAPELVAPLSEAGDGYAKKIKIRGMQEGWAWTERKWSKVTSDTGIGNPAKATKEKGEKYFNDVVDKVAQLIIDIANADLNDLYE